MNNFTDNPDYFVSSLFPEEIDELCIQDDFEDIESIVCPKCRGAGYIEELLSDCSYCDGVGYL